MHFQRQQEMKEFLYVNENLRGGDEEVPGQQRFQTENKDDDGNNLASENKKKTSLSVLHKVYLSTKATRCQTHRSEGELCFFSFHILLLPLLLCKQANPKILTCI